jgi:glutathione S-transferase
LKTYQRNPKTYLSPPELAKLHPTGAAPIIEDDGGVLLAETGAIVEYILVKHGKGKLVVGPDAKNYTDYLYWLHFANGYFQPALSRFSEFAVDYP